MAAPKHPKGAKSDKLWRDALMRAVKRPADFTPPTKSKDKKLEVLAAKVVELGCGGDMQAIKEIGDRLDGRPSQAVTGADDGPIEFTVKWATS